MTLEINTAAKTIKIKDCSVSLNDLVIELEKIFPNNQWKEYQIIGIETVYQTYPSYPFYPFSEPDKWIVTCDAGTSLFNTSFSTSNSN